MYDIDANESFESIGNFDILTQFTQDNFPEEVKEGPSEAETFRFNEPVTNDDLVAFKNVGDNTYTQRSTNWSMRLWSDWRNERNNRTDGVDFVSDLLDLNDESLNKYLSFIILEIRRVDGKPYPPNTLYSIVCGLLRYMKEHSKNSKACKACYFHIRALHHIRASLTTEASKTIAVAIVGSRLDYCNSLLAGTSVSNLTRLQHVQNALARVVAQKPRFCHITPVLSDLHWLPVRHRISFKIATVTFRVLQFQQPTDLASLIPKYVPARALRSASVLSICVPPRKTTIAASKSFSSVASNIWNSLPSHLSSIPALPRRSESQCQIIRSPTYLALRRRWPPLPRRLNLVRSLCMRKWILFILFFFSAFLTQSLPTC